MDRMKKSAFALFFERASGRRDATTGQFVSDQFEIVDSKTVRISPTTILRSNQAKRQVRAVGRLRSKSR